MKIIVPIIFIAVLIFICLPAGMVFAECSTTGTTVVFINGIRGTESTATADKDNFKIFYDTYGKSKNVIFLNGFNPKHLGGFDDYLAVIEQMYKGGKQDFDLTNILIKLHTDLKTQKIVLVGHSQGSFYTNATYEWLVSKGVSRNSIAVYNVGSAASFVAGNGEYITSKNDKVIVELATDLAKIGSARVPLPPNVELPVLESQKNDSLGGHDFSKNYLEQAGDTMISTLDGLIGSLQAGDAVKEECFTPPKTGVAFFLQDKGYMLADSVLNDPKMLATAPENPADRFAGVIEVLKPLINQVADAMRDNPGAFATAPADPRDRFAFFGDFANSFFAGIQSLLAKGFGGASLSTALEQNNNKNEPAPEPEPEPEPPVQLSLQDQLDDIEEKLDLLAIQVAELVAQSKQDNMTEEEDAILAVLADIVSGSNSSKTYPKILISEVKIAEKTGDNDVFIELYNPNSTEVDLTDWYIFRNDTTFIPKTTLSGQKISAKGYFLITREGSVWDNPLTPTFDDTLNEDDKISLKDPNGDVADETSWTTIQSGLTFGRKWDPVTNSEQDFELQNPTPRAQNDTYIYVEPVPLKNVLINEIQTDSINGTGGTDDDWVELYNPNNTDVSLAGWSIQRASNAGIIYHVKNFEDSAKIPAYGHFLIVRSIANQNLLNLADTTCSDLQLSDKNVVYLVAKQEIIIDGNDPAITDKVGFGLASDYETKATTNPIGGKSIERKIIWSDTNNNFDDFIVSSIPTPGQDLIKDKTDYNLSLGNDGGAYWYEIILEWQSPYQDVDSFDVRSKLNDGSWKDLLLGTKDATGKFPAFYSIISDENIYSFQVRSRDASGNLSDWRQIDIDLSSPVVINEVALYGTNASRYDKWIELYNKTGKPVNVTGWRLQRASNPPIYLSGTIPAFGYFILESASTAPNSATPDNVISDITANATSTQAIGTTKLNLLDKNARMVDQFYIPQDGIVWQESDFKTGANYHSMERISPYAEGMYAKNWKINNGIIINGQDRTGGNIYGTPGAQNSNYLQYTLLPKALGGDTELPKAFGPYLVDGDLSIHNGAVLTINPGTVLKFYDGYSNILAYGTLKAVGSGSEKIIFTSFKAEPAPGDWLGIKFLSDSKNSEISNAEIRYAGSVSPINWGIAVWVEGTEILLKNTLFENNKNTAVKLDSFDTSTCSTVDNVRVIGQGDDASRGVVIYQGSPEVKNSYFENNAKDKAIEVLGTATPNLHDNTIIDPPEAEMESMMLLEFSKDGADLGSDDLIL